MNQHQPAWKSTMSVHWWRCLCCWWSPLSLGHLDLVAVDIYCLRQYSMAVDNWWFYHSPEHLIYTCCWSIVSNLLGRSLKDKCEFISFYRSICGFLGRILWINCERQSVHSPSFAVNTSSTSSVSSICANGRYLSRDIYTSMTPPDSPK